MGSLRGPFFVGEIMDKEEIGLGCMLATVMIISFCGLFYMISKLPKPQYTLVEATLISRNYYPPSFRCCERHITEWDCGEYGIITSQNDTIYRFAHKKDILILRNGQYIEGIYHSD